MKVIMKLYSTLLGVAVFAAVCFEYGQAYSLHHTVEKQRIHLQEDSLWSKISGIQTEFSVYTNRIRKLPAEIKDSKMNLFFDSVWSDGISRWKKSPKNTRRYQWFLWITKHPPRFYIEQDSTVDFIKQKLWQTEYANFTKEYFDFLSSKPKDQHTWSKLEYDHLKLQGDLELAMVIYKTTGKKLDLKTTQRRAVKLAKEMAGTDFFAPLTQSLGNIFSNKNLYGLTDESEINSFLHYLIENGNVDLAKWASGKERLIKLKEVPFDYSFKIQEGSVYDLSQKRGKVVLVDFWATWCGTCIAKMPMIKEVHDKYKEQGFEVLSISINSVVEKAKIGVVEKRIGVDWPLSIIGNTPLKDEIWKRFAFTGVPQLLLIGKDGKLIENNGLLFKKNTLENLVKKALSE